MTRCYPLQALLDATGLTMAGLRELCPTNGSTYRLAIDRGLLPDQADRWAVRCGLHPFEVWPEMLDDNLADCPQGCTTSNDPSGSGEVAA